VTTNFATDFRAQAWPERVAEHGETASWTTPAGVTTSGLSVIIHRHGTQWTAMDTGSVELERATIRISGASLAQPQRNGYFTAVGPDGANETWYVQSWRTSAGLHACECVDEHVAERLHAPRGQYGSYG